MTYTHGSNKNSMRLFYSPSFTSSAHGFDTTRKATWIAESLTERPIDGVKIVAPTLVAAEDLALVHDVDYIEAVRTGRPRDLAESQGFKWDPRLWEMTIASTGGVVDAARAALSDGMAGSLSSGLHHAKRGRGEGFCTFNGLAVAAKRLLADGAVSSVLILDFDAHCGGGTAELIDGDPRIRQADVSTSLYDCYPDTENATLHDVVDAGEYLPAVRRALAAAPTADLCLYNAGMDPYEGCAIGGLDGITATMLAEREHAVFEWCRGRGMPVAFVLAGGYVGSRLSQEELVNLHRLTITQAALPRRAPR